MVFHDLGKLIFLSIAKGEVIKGEGRKNKTPKKGVVQKNGRPSRTVSEAHHVGAHVITTSFLSTATEVLVGGTHQSYSASPWWQTQIASTLELLPCGHCCDEHCIWVLCGHAFISLTVQLLGHMVSLRGSLRSCQTILHDVCTILHSTSNEGSSFPYFFCFNCQSVCAFAKETKTPMWRVVRPPSLFSSPPPIRILGTHTHLV